jgi:hypothetical protein
MMKPRSSGAHIDNTTSLTSVCGLLHQIVKLIANFLAAAITKTHNSGKGLLQSFALIHNKQLLLKESIVTIATITTGAP